MGLSHYCRRGVVISQEPGSDRKVESQLRTCCHCRFTWQPRPGSGRMMGFCTRCMGDLCGRPACVATGCVCQEQQIENMEAGRPLDFSPIIVHVSATPPGG